MDAVLENVADSEVVVKRIRPIWKQGESDVARVSQLNLADRDGTKVAWGLFYRYEPPSEIHDGDCFQQPTRSVSGFRIEPGKIAGIAATIDVLRRGRFEISGWEVSYAQGDELFSQSIMTGVAGRSSRTLPPEPLGRLECAGKKGQRLNRFSLERWVQGDG